MKVVYLFVAFMGSLILGGCAMTPPQNSDEFVSNAKRSMMFMKKHTEQVEENFKIVSNRVTDKLIPCLSGDVVERARVMHGDGAVTGTETHTVWYPTFHKYSNEYMRLALQLDYRDRVMPGIRSVPKGGMYMAAIDIKKIDEKKTNIDYYVQSNVADDVFEPAIAILNGREGACKFNRES